MLYVPVLIRAPTPAALRAAANTASVRCEFSRDADAALSACVTTPKSSSARFAGALTCASAVTRIVLAGGDSVAPITGDTKHRTKIPGAHELAIFL
jgi:hypothetical protein